MDWAVSKRFTELDSFADCCQFCIFVASLAVYIATTLGIHIMIVNLEVVIITFHADMTNQ